MDVDSGRPAELQRRAAMFAKAAEQHREAAALQRRHGRVRQAEEAEYRARMAELRRDKVLVELSGADEAEVGGRSLQELAAEAYRLRLEVAELRIALESNRLISRAVGVLMSRHVIAAEVAFAMLRRASQVQHRKLAGVAEEILLVGEMSADIVAAVADGG